MIHSIGKIISCSLVLIASSYAINSFATEASNSAPLYKNFNQTVKQERIKDLSKIEYYVTQKNGTEYSGTGPYDNLFKKGLYVDIVSGEPLFVSSDKFQAESGWPAFTKPVSKDAVKIVKSTSIFGGVRLEVRSKIADSHLGDLFYDRYNTNPSSIGKVTGIRDSKQGLPRYCIDSAALKFISYDQLAKQGYGDYIKYFS